MTSALSVSAMTLAGLTRGLCYAATVSDKRAVTSFISLNCPRSSRQANLLRLCRSTRARYYALPQFPQAKTEQERCPKIWFRRGPSIAHFWCPPGASTVTARVSGSRSIPLLLRCSNHRISAIWSVLTVQTPWEARLVIEASQVLGVITFGAFMVWALKHLFRMFR